MQSLDGRLALTFNGEIYNYRRLRSELEARGRRFRSQTDTEVLLHTMHEWGIRGLERLEGMFSFALWDETRRTLTLARDRLGVKPLYYAEASGTLAFASEIRAILASECVVPALDPSALESYLRLLWVPDPDTLFNGIRKVEPGCYLTWDGSALRSTRYWDVPQCGPDGASTRGHEEGLAALRERLQSAVTNQLVSDVPLGAFLSGGLDSTCLLAMASKAGTRPLRTYSIGFRSADRKEEGALDDLGYARMAASAFGSEHHEIVLEPNVVDLLPKMVRHLEDPVADPAAINTYLVCLAARETSTVLLSGSGGDELFGGYYKYVGANLGAEYQRIAGPLRKWIVEPMATALPVAVGRIGLRSVRRAKRFLRHAGLPAFDRFMGYSCYYDADELEDLLGGDPKGDIDPYMGIGPLKEAWDRRTDGDAINRMTYVDLKYYLPGLGLAYMDKASMAASVEVRVPLLDDVLVDYVARLPGSAKVEGVRTKIMFRDAMTGVVPEAIRKRPKAPFAAPVRSWLRRDLAPLVDEYLGPSRVLTRGLLNPGFVQRMIQEHRSGLEDHSLRIWALLTLEVWLQEFQDNARQFVLPLGEEGVPASITTQETV